MNIIDKINGFLITKVYAQSLGDRFDDVVRPVGEVDSNDPVGPYVGKIVKIAAPIAVISCFILLVYGGYLLSASSGNPDKIQEAKSIMTNAVIGLLVVLLSVVILLIISNTMESGGIIDQPIYE
ncbi:MAG TPA: hypothetical protein VJY47_02990 [Candidatus Dojkabacteria bacterium]|nr:hypothetical protein [Candidatus Dojkabacteria bacterium]